MIQEFLFKPLQESDLNLLCHWLSESHVKEWWRDEVEGTMRIDQFIGEEDLINRGIGTKMICAFIDDLFLNSNIKKIITDIDPKNLSAMRCYEKLGFEFVKEIRPPDGIV